MPFAELEPVVLAVDLPERNLRAGARGVVVLVCTVPNLAYQVEFFDDEGEAIFPFTVLPEQLKAAAEERG